MVQNIDLDLNVELNQESNQQDEDIPLEGTNHETNECSNPNVVSQDVEVDDLVAESDTDGVGSTYTINESSDDEVQNITRQAKIIAARLAPGSTIKNLDEAYILYCEYARLIGFSVKKGTQSYIQKTAVVRMKMFFCSSEGHTDNRASSFKLAAYKKQHCRTDCRARLRVVLNGESQWVVSVFETQHNHALLGPDESYLLRSSRNLSLVKRSVLEQFNAAGIGVSRAFRFVEHSVGGPESVGFIKKDAYDHMDRIRRVGNFGNADSEALMKYFQEKSESEPNFFWRNRLDDQGRLMNLYFRDGRCADDYALFGDVISVDTTFRMNKYNLICAPIVGMNHHRQTIMFGVGFLSDETSESFEWLFNVFLESVGKREPQIIFTDQDQAMKNGIDIAFNRAAHRLCQ